MHTHTHTHAHIPPHIHTLPTHTCWCHSLLPAASQHHPSHHHNRNVHKHLHSNLHPQLIDTYQKQMHTHTHTHTRIFPHIRMLPTHTCWYHSLLPATPQHHPSHHHHQLHCPAGSSAQPRAPERQLTWHQMQLCWLWQAGR